MICISSKIHEKSIPLFFCFWSYSALKKSTLMIYSLGQFFFIFANLFDKIPYLSHKTEKSMKFIHQQYAICLFILRMNNKIDEINQRAMPSCSLLSDSQSDAVALKFCLLLRTRDLYKSDLWQTTTVPP